LFLDEIGDVDLQVQPKLLKVLKDKRFRRLGDVKDRFAEVRLIAATHHDMNILLRSRKFREDLYFRISTIVLRLPALRERSRTSPFLPPTSLAASRTSLDMAERNSPTARFTRCRSIRGRATSAS
jgi:transcriptional regulator with GAF, ATPase, and Fis domain